MKRVLFLIIALFGLNSCSTFTEELDNVFEVSTPSLIEAPAEGDSFTIQIQTRCSYTFTCKADWVVIPKKERPGNTIASETIKITENKLPVARETQLIIANEYYDLKERITIKQAAAGPYIDVPVQSITAQSQGESVEFEVSANVDYTLASSESWCRLSTTKGKVGENVKYTLTVDMNKTTESRTAKITISNSYYGFSQTITLEQAVANYLTYTSANKVTPNCAGAKVSVLSNTWENGEGLIVFDGPLTTISDSMFAECKDLTSVTIPDSVTSIGYAAFLYCSALTSIIIPDSVISIGQSAFDACVSLKSVEIGNGVTSIGESAFYGCSSLESVTIPNGVTSIGKTVFISCHSLKNVTIPDSVTSIKDGAFKNCSSLTSIIIPDSVISIGDSAFSGCSGLTSITIPGSITAINNYAFYGCSGLTSVTIGNSVTSIGNYAFSGCSSLTNVTIGNSVTSIGNYAFSGCSSLASVTIPDSVTSIGYAAFLGCSSLASVTIPYSVTLIDEWAFSKCSRLTSVTIPKSVTSIELGTFQDCSALTSVTIPNSITSIGKQAFRNCNSLASVTIPDSVTSIGEFAFYGCISLASVTIPDSVTSIGAQAFCACGKLESVHCNSATPPTLGGKAFDNNASARMFYVGAADVDAYKAAASWSSYKSYIVPVYGEEYKLYYTSSNNKVVEPSSSNFNANIVSNTYKNGEGVIIFDKPLTSIGYRAFYARGYLSSVTIPKSVISIGASAFQACSLSKVYCKATTPPQGGYNMFYGNSDDLKIYVPTNSVSAYKAPQHWSEFSSKIVGYNF